jgi:4-alpha-glucanotransferase
MYNAGSDMVLVPLQDIFGWRDRINHPATISDANWTYTLPWPVDRLEQHAEAVERAGQLAEWCRGARRWVPPYKSVISESAL